MQGGGHVRHDEMRRKMLMGMQVSADDPGAVLALKSDLNLTQDQTDKVQKFQDNARKDTRDALTDSQRQQIAGLEGTPQSMVALCRHMSQQGWTGATAGAATTGPAGTGASGSMETGTGTTTGTMGATGTTTGTTGNMHKYESGDVHARRDTGTTTGTTGAATGTTGTYGATATPSGASATGACAGGSVSAGTGTATGTAGTAGTNVGTMSESQIMAQDQAGCKAMGMSDPMQMRRKMLMGMQVSTDDPSAILALKSDLNLTQDQVDKIQKIQDNARKCTRDILNDSQKQQLSSLEGTPQSMVSMCRQMAQQGWISGTPGATPSTGAVTGTTGTMVARRRGYEHRHYGAYGTGTARHLGGASSSSTGTRGSSSSSSSSY